MYEMLTTTVLCPQDGVQAGSPCSLSVGCEDLGPEAVPTCSGCSAALGSVPFLAWMAQESPVSGLQLLRHDMW